MSGQGLVTPGGGLELYIVEGLSSGLFTAVLLAVPLWRIFRRAGLTPALSLFVFVPWLGLLIVLGLLALRDWPAHPSDVVEQGEGI